MFGFYVIKRYEMRKLHMSSKQGPDKAGGGGHCHGVALLGGRHVWWKEGKANGLSRM